MDSPSALANLNGQILPRQALPFAPAQRWAQYGDGLFESFLCVGGRLPFWPLHAARLAEGLRFLQLDAAQLPQSAEDWLAQIRPCLGPWPLARVRLSVFRSAGGLYAPQSDRAQFLIECAALEGPVFQGHIIPEIGLCEGLHLPQWEGSRHKSSNALPYVLAARQRQQAGWQEALLCNAAGRAVEGSAANLFIWEKGRLLCPPLSEGGVAGTMRALLLRYAAEAGIPHAEIPLPLERLRGADALWFCNAIQGPRPVARWGPCRYDTTLGLDAALSWLKRQLPSP